jgi:hypothetical protein
MVLAEVVIDPLLHFSSGGVPPAREPANVLEMKQMAVFMGEVVRCGLYETDVTKSGQIGGGIRLLEEER